MPRISDPVAFESFTSVRYASSPTTYESVCSTRIPESAASTTVTSRYGSNPFPDPLTGAWLTSVHGSEALPAVPARIAGP